MRYEMIKHEQKQAGITHIHNHFIAHSYPVTGVTKLFNFFMKTLNLTDSKLNVFGIRNVKLLKSF